MSTDALPSPVKSPILVMTAGGPNPWMVINALAQRFDAVQVLIEEPEGKGEIFRRRAKRLGRLQAAGQLATMAAAKLLRRAAGRRMEAICQQHGADPRFNTTLPVTSVRSINAPETLEAVTALQPAVILLVSTRLMTRSMLAAMPCPVLNLHAGINPIYRGQMGGYWSLVLGDRENFGATIHLVDAGTDTGETLYEARTEPAAGDFLSTYPMLLTAAALPSVCQAIEDALTGNLRPKPASGPSALRFPPTLWAWVWNGVSKGIW
ncbi:formyl transferase [Rhizobium paknamense]|uniref:Methionyl-tRNA formyltransferase n=1 Tax=Rhizobium paknamense TaxID=1206817 RepID=A0ABU0I6G4_9HYPH|nr:formyl transferase [Rhizobium paknamense]MDQ0453807.1 methionyl-tRNA formyltransferase [Rhizobium paknamense]